MTDENKPEETPESPEAEEQQSSEPAETATATEEAPEAEHEHHHHDHDHDHDHTHDHGEEKLKQTVDVTDAGPCKKHIKVTVDREMIDDRIKEKFREVGRDENVPGFRKGKAPLKVIMRRYGKEVSDQVKGEVLMASLEQLAEENLVAPLSSPDLDPSKIVFPDDGPLVYEFEVEVRPEFDLPEYKGLKLKKPVYEYTDEDVQREKQRVLFDYGDVIPKDGKAELGDLIVADTKFQDGDQELATNKELTFRIEKSLAFKDGVAENFADQVAGVNSGEQKVVDVKLSSQVADENLRGKTVQLHLDVKDVKTVRLPELTEEFLEETFGVSSEAQFDELFKVALERRLEHQQRQSARQQLLEHIAADADWDLPEDLLIRQARRAMSRRVMEMRSDGIPEAEIQSRIRMLEQDILQSTEISLKEHFVLQKIAEVEKIEVTDDDIADEIDRMAYQSGESPRRVRARLEKEDMIDALASDMIERKALELIFASAEWEEVKLGQEEVTGSSVGTVEEQAVPGQMRDLEAESAEAEQKETESEEEG